MMEKRYYLNPSNSKHIKIGIKPATSLFNKEFTGFFVDVVMDGKTMKPVSLGGLDGFLNLCQSLRGFEELKFVYPGSVGNYEIMNNPLLMNINKKNIGGSVCFVVDTQNGDNFIIAQNTCQELLKNECIIIAAIQTFSSLSKDVEKKFNNLVNTSTNDFTATLADVRKTGDLLNIEILINFNELFKVCVDETTRFKSASATERESLKRKRAPPKRTKAAKKSEDHIVIETVESDSIEPNDTNESASDSAGEPSTGDANAVEIDDHDYAATPLGITESGQRMEPELYM